MPITTIMSKKHKVRVIVISGLHVKQTAKKNCGLNNIPLHAVYDAETDVAIPVMKKHKVCKDG